MIVGTFIIASEKVDFLCSLFMVLLLVLENGH